MTRKSKPAPKIPKHLDFDADTLLRAVDATFRNRETPIPTEEPEAFSAAFVEEHGVQWNALVRRIGDNELAGQLGKIVQDLKLFAIPLLGSLSGEERTAREWKHGQGWMM